MCWPIEAAINGAIARTPTKTTRIRLCTKAKVRPRTSSATSMPSMVKPVTQVIPLKEPRIITIKTAKTRFGMAASATKKKPLMTREAPKRRRLENCANTRGPKAIPAARPVKTAPKRTP